jgi:hypothetical protein
LPAAAAPVQPADPTFIQYASARRTEQMQAEQSLIALVLRGPESQDDAAARSATSLFSSEMLRTLSEAGTRKSGA